jgi:RND family efflux transporter MFP subunit
MRQESESPRPFPPVPQMKMHHPAAVLAALFAAALSGCGRPAPAPAKPSAPTVSVANPVPRSVNEWDEFAGRLVSPETVEIRARVSGYIDKVHFKEGGDVKAGDLLFTIDRRPYQAIVDRARADLGAAKARAELAEGEAKRGESLAASKAISTDTYQTRLMSAAGASEAVNSAEAALKAAELDLEFTEVRSPIAGRISNARVTAGNLVTGGSTAATTLLTTVVSLDPIYCYLQVDEASALKYRQLFREGRRVSALFDQIPAEMALGNESGFPHKGTIDFVDNQLDPATGTIRARAVFPNKDRLMSPGFFARIRMPGDGEYPAVLVRDNALASDQGRSFLVIIDDKNVAAYRPVKTGPMMDGLRVIRSGLTAEDRVVVDGLMSVRPGTVVTPQLVPMASANRPVAAAKP